MSTVCAGTVHYRAPEVLAHARYRSPVDIWSLGVVGLEHLEELPNEDDSSTEADYALCISDHAEFLAIYDPSHTHRHLLSQMLREKPAERPTAVQCLEAVSDLIAQGTPPVTPSQIEPVTRGGHEHPHSGFDSQDTVLAPRSPHDRQTSVRRWSNRYSHHGGDQEEDDFGDNGDDQKEDDFGYNSYDSRNRRSDAPPPETPRRASSVLRLSAASDENYSLGAGPPAPSASALPSVSAPRKRDPNSSASGSSSTGSDRHTPKRQATAHRLSVVEEALPSDSEVARMLLVLKG